MALLVAVILGAGTAFVTYVGSRLSQPVPQRIGSPPVDLDARAVTFPSSSGATVHGWLLVASEQKGSVLLLPGVRANRLSMVDHARFLRRAGYSVLLIDLQATGETEGRHITFGWLESRDARAAVEFLRREVPGSPIAILGMSLGGAAALLASPPLEVEAMILEAVYPTVERATRNRLRIYLGPLGELGAPMLLVQLGPRIGVSASELRPIERIGNIRCPILIIGGAQDRHTTPADSRLLFSRARGRRELWVIPNVGHVDFHRARGAEYEQRVLAFLSDAFARRSGE